MFTTCVYGGLFAGPTAAGILVQRFGFRHTSALFFSLYCLLVPMDLTDIIYKTAKEKRNPKSPDYTLLNCQET